MSLHLVPALPVLLAHRPSEDPPAAGRVLPQQRPALLFFQAEDGIRPIGVTGVQTCALPIFLGIALILLVPEIRRAASSTSRISAIPRISSQRSGLIARSRNASPPASM